jgi:hypothetical protein
MRSTLAAAVFAAVLFCVAAAQAEKRVFIIPGGSDGYGVDHCLASGAACGAPVANAYCHSHEYGQALSYRKVDRDDMTGAIPASGAGSCHGTNCDELVAITCLR